MMAELMGVDDDHEVVGERILLSLLFSPLWLFIPPSFTPNIIIFIFSNLIFNSFLFCLFYFSDV